MAAIINAIFGSYPEQQQDPTTTTQSATETSCASSECLQTIVSADNVLVSSVISSDTQANLTIKNQIKLDELLAQLSTTHAQIDQYSRARTTEITEQVIVLSI